MAPARSLSRRQYPLAALLFFCASLVLHAAPASSLEPGDAAPSFSIPRLDGTGDLELAAYEGKVVFLDFWASWCPPCLTSLPLLDSLRSEFPADRFEVVAINLDEDPAVARRFLDKLSVSYPNGNDASGKTPERFEIETMPTSFLIDGEGVIRHVHRGFRKGDVPELRSKIAALVESGGAGQ